MDRPDTLPSSSVDATPASGEENAEIPQGLSQEDLRKHLEALRLSPKDIPPKRRQKLLGWAALIVIVCLLAWGVLSAFDLTPTLGSGWPLAKGTSINLASANGRYVVILERCDRRGEVKMVDTTTGEVQDISQGDMNSSHAALSPDGSLVAYVSTDDEGSSLYLVGTTGGITTTFLGSSLNASTNSALNWEETKVCAWSELYWSPECDHLAFFGCSEGRSVLLVVPSQADAMPTVIGSTEASGDGVRNAVWLERGRIVLVSGKVEHDSLILIDLGNQIPQRLYGPLW